MAEQLNLTQSIPATTLWRVQSLTLHRGLSHVGSVTPEPDASRITVILVGDGGRTFAHTWSGASADADIIALNKANLGGAGGSLEKRILNRLIADGILEGAVAGSPD